MTQVALSFVEIPEIDYTNAVRELLKDPTTGKQMEKIENACKDKQDPRGPLKDKEEVKKIYLEMMQMEASFIKT